jgi:site-specific DNA-methyltransferase (adenine-specific)
VPRQKIDLIQGDCLKILTEEEDNTIDIVITSPPYANRRKGHYKGQTVDNYLDWFLPIALEIRRVLKPTGSFFLNIKPHCDNGQRVLYVMKLVIELTETVGLRFTDEFVWTKTGVPGKYVGRFKNAFEPIYHFTKEKGYTHNPYNVTTEAKEISKARYKRKTSRGNKNGSGIAGLRKEIKTSLALPSNHLHIPHKGNQYCIQSQHPAVYPVELCKFFILAFSNELDIVLDPFMGSGTTGVAAKELNRRFIGVEQEENWYELAKKRIKEFNA